MSDAIDRLVDDQLSRGEKLDMRCECNTSDHRDPLCALCPTTGVEALPMGDKPLSNAERRRVEKIGFLRQLGHLT